ncbi:hypothetical protein [Candidatus Neptunochlamydia vexilliferae]|uniref:Uncharacterized protein n=1 Tax=Candidatus Neptunichlamydia vexilliferae TaxID=1651774 RepID=A0ABS0AX12_9BACT|nr:hypothetical protein [Candidatus Neptunochlamydia vexilliferae]MBF5058668.1 hypothetical protein [Candidatus Neptunochlamydia vexilliferae]
MAYPVISSKNTQVSTYQQLSYSGIKVKDPKATAVITGVLLGVNIHRRKYLVTSEELGEINSILGAGITNQIPTYIQTCNTVDKALSLTGLKLRRQMYSKWPDRSQQRFQRLIDFIMKCPFCIILPDNQCRSGDGEVLTVHKIEISASDSRISAIVTPKFAALSKRSSKSTYTLAAVSENAMAALAMMANRSSIHLDMVDKPTQPLMPHSATNSQKDCCNCLML